MIDLLNIGSLIAIGLAVIIKRNSSFLWFMFLYCCIFTYSNYQLFEVFKPDVNYYGHMAFYFSLSLMICVAIAVLITYKFLAARILTAALCIQAIGLLILTVSGMEVFGFTIPQGEIINYFISFVNVNILMLETVIAWIVATHRKG